MDYIIKASNLKKTFGSNSERTTVIDNLNISIRPGSFTIIMGSSGSGKSTLLYLLSGLDEPSKGQIEIDGVVLNGNSEMEMAVFRRNKIGFVFQDHNLISSLTLLENILIAGYLGVSKRKIVEARADHLMEKLEIKSLENRYPSEVSGGEKQRCAIARAMINNPSIIMADEPTGNLNSAASQKVLESFVAMKESGQSVLMVTHDPKTASYADVILFMKDGNILDSISFEAGLMPSEKQGKLLNWLMRFDW